MAFRERSLFFVLIQAFLEASQEHQAVPRERGYDPFSSGGANLNLIIGGDARDPISGTAPHRAYLCEIRRVD